MNEKKIPCSQESPEYPSLHRHFVPLLVEKQVPQLEQVLPSQGLCPVRIIERI